MPVAVNPNSPSMGPDATAKPKGARQAVAVATYPERKEMKTICL